MKTTIGNLKKMVAAAINEARGHVSPQEVLQTYQDIYLSNQGQVPLAQLASFVGANPDQVFMAALRKAGLLVDKKGNVVERGMTPSS
jgi:hypothetical protein